MTPDKTHVLRDVWKKAGDLLCDHLVLVMGFTENGYLTGQYICTRCGAEVSARTQAEPLSNVYRDTVESGLAPTMANHSSPSEGLEYYETVTGPHISEDIVLQQVDDQLHDTPTYKKLGAAYSVKRLWQLLLWAMLFSSRR